MFRDTKAFSGFAVDDIDAARAFYGETLGLKVTDENGLLTLHIAGDRPTLIYPKPDHTPSTRRSTRSPSAGSSSCATTASTRTRRA